MLLILLLADHSTISIEDPIDKAVEKYKNHLSIKKVKECFTCSESFHFRQGTVEEVLCQLRKLNPRKSHPLGSIPAKVMKENSDILHQFLKAISMQLSRKMTFQKLSK